MYLYILKLSDFKKDTSCIAGCGGPACSPVAVCVPNDTRSSDPASCAPLEQWCPFQRRCLPLASPCHPSSCLNCSQGHHLPPGALMPQYTLQHEVVFTLPAGPAAHVLVRGFSSIYTLCLGFVYEIEKAQSKWIASFNLRVSV